MAPEGAGKALSRCFGRLLRKWREAQQQGAAVGATCIVVGKGQHGDAGLVGEPCDVAVRHASHEFRFQIRYDVYARGGGRGYKEPAQQRARGIPSSNADRRLRPFP
jgi:hypothetical protein